MFEGDQTGAQLGISVAGAGDANGDGFGEIAIGAQQYDAGQSNEGAAFVFAGSASGIASASAAAADQRLEADRQGFYFGTAAAPAGDVNGDDRADLVVGTSFWGNPQSGEGAFFVFRAAPEPASPALGAAGALAPLALARLRRSLQRAAALRYVRRR